MNAQPTFYYSIPASEELFARLSPGSVFHRQPGGRHLLCESVIISIDGQTLYGAIAYATSDDGTATHAFVNRSLTRVPRHFPMEEILEWQAPIPCSTFLRPDARRHLPEVVAKTRFWVQEHARNGWRLPRHEMNTRVTLDGSRATPLHLV